MRAGITRQKYRNPYAYAESVDPTATPDTGYTYTNDVGGRTELMYMDDTGAEVQITSAGNLSVGAGALPPPFVVESGTVGSIRAGASSTTFAVYNTSTSANANYERIQFSWASNVAQLQTQKAGTGVARTFSWLLGGSASAAFTVNVSYDGGISFAPNATSVNPSVAICIFGAGARTATSGTVTEVAMASTFQDAGTNSTTSARVLTIIPTVNYTGASRTGKVVGIYLNPTLTSQPTGNNAGISFSSAFASSTFPPFVAYNTADEDTNWERFEMSWGISSNLFCIRNQKGGTGTLRSLNFCYSGTTVSALIVPTATTTQLDIAVNAAVGTAIALGRIALGRASTVTATSGTHYGVLCSDSPAPSSTSTMQFVSLGISPTINYSNGTPGAGFVYGIYINPTNTALPTGRSAALSFSSTSSGLSTGSAMVFNNQTDEQTNYEAVTFGYSANNFNIDTTKGGTGTARNIVVRVSGVSKQIWQATRFFLASTVGIVWDNNDSFGTTPVSVAVQAIAGTMGAIWTINGTLTSSPGDFDIERWSTTLAGAFTVTRLNLFVINQPAGAATITDMCLYRVDAAIGTHKMIDAGTTKTSPGTVTAWEKKNINGTIHYTPLYASKTT